MGKKGQKRQKSEGIYKAADAQFQYQESINSLRTNLRFVSMTGECKKIVITSAIPNEGKTTIAINLSYSLASAGSKVLLIDCDLRKPALQRYMKLSPEPSKGLINLLRYQSAPDNESYHFIQQNFFVLTSGAVPPNPAAILGSSLMKDLLEMVSDQFDYVIMDTAPVSAVTDAAVLSQFADGILMVVRQKLVTFEQARQAKKNLDAVNANILGVVLNGFDIRHIDKKSGYYYSYYHSSAGGGDQPAIRGK